MKLKTVSLLTACALLGAPLAFAGEPAKKEHKAKHDPHAAHHEQKTPPTHVAVALPTSAGAGAAQESKIIAETEHVKTALIILRKGTVLPEHHSPFPVTIQSLSGKGTVRMGKTNEELSPARMVVLSPAVPHEVAPEKGGDLVILVHHFKTGKAGAEAHAH